MKPWTQAHLAWLKSAVHGQGGNAVTVVVERHTEWRILD
jgi:hypothetical protein